ncbi:MAG: hypothetical protein KDI32_09710 [Pseudomonadales bacterium]|nr:hypothetical protein [Pseudomonadales bacterium]
MKSYWFPMGFAGHRVSSWVLALAIPLATLSGCASLSPTACARHAMAPVDFAGMYDKQAHCIASGLIDQQCGARYARMAGVGKEWLDAFGAGDASRGDLRADADGRACAAQLRQPNATAQSGAETPTSPDAFRAALAVCCEQRWPDSRRDTPRPPAPAARRDAAD